MRRKVNPILKKELVLGARTIRFPIALMCYSGCMAVTALLFLAASYSSYSGEVNYATLTSTFVVLAFAQLVLIGIIVPVLTAGSIAGERERQTLDLLLTAPVKSITIVTGKLLSCLCNVLLFVISSIPAMAVAFLYGGIQWRYLLVFVVAILLMAFFSGAIGMWTAAIFRKTILSTVVTFVIELVFLIGPALITWGTYMVKYQAQVQANADAVSAHVQMGFLPVILFLDPAIGFVDAIMQTYVGIGVVQQFLSYSIIGTVPDALIALAGHWCWISLVVTAALGVGFLFLAAGRLESGRQKEKFQQPVKKRNKKRR